MDLKVSANRTDCLHICHVDTDELENGIASIVTLVRTAARAPDHYKVNDVDEVEAFIDQRGFFRAVCDGSFIYRDNWEMK